MLSVVMLYVAMMSVIMLRVMALVQGTAKSYLTLRSRAQYYKTFLTIIKNLHNNLEGLLH
jgi:hypothetical protein